MTGNVRELFDDDEFFSVPEWTRWKLGERPPSATNIRSVSVELVQRWLTSPWFFLCNFLYVVTKDTDESLFRPFAGQAYLYYAREIQRRLGFAQRIVEIKPRQVGWTTVNLGLGFHRMFHPRTKVVCLVPDDDVSEDFMLRVSTFYNALPEAMVPMKQRDNRKTLYFDNPDPRTRQKNRGFASSFNITTPASMRGKTPNELIVSEAAHMPEFTDIQEGLITAMPLGPSSCVVIDTTPAGFDDVYYPMVMQACERNPHWVAKWGRGDPAPSIDDIFNGYFGVPDQPGDGWVPVFWPWFWHEEYGTKDDHPRGQLQALTDQQRQHITATLGKYDQYGNDEEVELVKKYGASLGRIAYRRYRLDNDSTNADIQLRLLRFRQEYATTFDSCFVEYNFSPFDRQGMAILSRQQRDPVAVGVLRRDEKHAVYIDTTARSTSQEVRLYAPPEPNTDYTIGVDTATAYESKDSDQSVAVVLRRRDDKVCAVYAARVPPYVLREQIELLYHWYNRAFLAIETEGVGYALPRELFDRGVTNQYRYKRFDQEVPMQTQYLGWETSSKTRQIMESIMIEQIGKRNRETGAAEPGLIVPDRQTLQQIQTLKRTESGLIKAQGRAHDDCALALMIALAASRDPYYPVRERKEYVPPPEPNALLRAGWAFRDGERNKPRYEIL